jgi:hypothetical protein
VGVLAGAAFFIGAIILLIMRRRRAKQEEEEGANAAAAPDDDKKPLPAELSSPIVEKRTGGVELVGSSPTSPADDYVPDRKDPMMGRIAPKGPTELAGTPGTPLAPLVELEAVEVQNQQELEAGEVQKQQE